MHENYNAGETWFNRNREIGHEEWLAQDKERKKAAEEAGNIGKGAK